MTAPEPRREAYADYLEMQKRSYEADVDPAEIVGFYDWHERFPYETQLLFVNGDVRLPLLEDLPERRALDFGCGPGRMVGRMAEIFRQVDGVDISASLIEAARAAHPGSEFWVTNGDDLGGAPADTYDLVYSTIAMQHIAVRSVRQRILACIHDVLKPDGAVSIQLAFNPLYPYLNPTVMESDGLRIEVRQRDTQHAAWSEDRTSAESTNSGCDAALGLSDLPALCRDFGEFFSDVRYWFYDVSLVYDNLLGAQHASDYWPTHWIFVSGYRRDEG